MHRLAHHSLTRIGGYNTDIVVRNGGNARVGAAFEGKSNLAIFGFAVIAGGIGMMLFDLTTLGLAFAAIGAVVVWHETLFASTTSASASE